MPRPTKPRWVECHPVADFFVPRGVPLERLEGTVLPVEGLEALRLADAEGFDHETAAALMGISRPTFSRILTDARTAVARTLVNGWALRISGGDFRIAGDDHPGSGPHGRRRGARGKGMGTGRRRAAFGRDDGEP
jgi:uncharacterized protein